MKKHKLSLWSEQCPEKPLEPCREVLFSIDKSDKIPTLNVAQGETVSLHGFVGKGKSRYV